MTLSEWIATSAGVMAALVPAILFLFERADRKAAETRALESERRELEMLETRHAEARAQAERSLAEGVFVWPEISPSGAAGVRLLNTSRSPVAHVMIDAITSAEGSEESRRLLYHVVVLAPGSDYFMPEDQLLGFDNFETHSKDWHPTLLMVREVRFTDANGSHWSRSMMGWASSSLRKLTGDEPWEELPHRKSADTAPLVDHLRDQRG